jgi:hypothetical protein
LLVTTIAVVLAYLLTKFTRPRAIAWFSDRDSISSAFGKVAYDLFLINHAGICQQNHVPYDSVRIGLGDPRPDPIRANLSTRISLQCPPTAITRRFKTWFE